MAFITPSYDVNNIQVLADLTQNQATAVKILFDKTGADTKTYIIALLAEFAKTTAGSSASENLGSATITGITGNTVYAQIANLLAIAQAAQAGTILPGVVTEAMLAFTVATQAELDTHAGLTPATSAHGLDATIAKFKKSSSSFTDNDTAQTFTDAFCTVDSLVTVSITSVTLPQGTWSVESGAGTFTITSTVAESADITFDYYIQKVV